MTFKEFIQKYYKGSHQFGVINTDKEPLKMVINLPFVHDVKEFLNQYDPDCNIVASQYGYFLYTIKPSDHATAIETLWEYELGLLNKTIKCAQYDKKRLKTRMEHLKMLIN